RPGLRGGDLPRCHPPRCWIVGLEHPNQRVQMGSEQIFATEVEYDALANSIALPIVLDQAEVSVGVGFGLAEEQGASSIHHKHSEMTRFNVKGEMHCHHQILSLQFLAKSKIN